MKRFFTLFLIAFAGTVAMAQNQEGEFKKASVAPVLDGVVDAVWAESNVYNIERTVVNETPSIGEPGESVWKGLWTPEGVYILLDIKDNEYLPNYLSGGTGAGFEDYNWDKLELYFDVNYNLADAQGPSVGKGHYQVAPGFAKDKVDGTLITGTDGVAHAFKVEGSHYIAEYFVPFSKLKDSEGFIVDKTSTIGFDVTVIDRDSGDANRSQAVWSNTGDVATSWTNMDGSGHVTFADAVANVSVENVSLNTGSITTDNGTLQMVATVTPSDATIKDVIWSVEPGTGKASIDSKGVLLAITNGTVTVKAVAADGMGAEATVDITISGQDLSRNDIWNNFNLVKNWNFDNLSTTGVTGLALWDGWLDGTGQMKPVVEEGVVAMTTALNEKNEQFHYQFNQSGLQALPEVPYVVTFKSWADVERPNTLDFEDTKDNGYNRYGVSSDAEAQDGGSEWHYTVTTEPQWFVFHVTFDEIKETTNQKIQWLSSQADGTIYMDSVLMVTQEEYDLLATLPVTGVKEIKNSISSVFPNPVINSLTVDFTAINSKVAVYNAIGQKLMEKTAKGSRVTFDVSSLTKGLYFVRLEDGSTKKFVK